MSEIRDQEERKKAAEAAVAFALTETPKHRTTEAPAPCSGATTTQQREHAEATEKRGGWLRDHTVTDAVKVGRAVNIIDETTSTKPSSFSTWTACSLLPLSPGQPAVMREVLER